MSRSLRDLSTEVFELLTFVWEGARPCHPATSPSQSSTMSATSADATKPLLLQSVPIRTWSLVFFAANLSLAATCRLQSGDRRPRTGCDERFSVLGHSVCARWMSGQPTEAAGQVWGVAECTLGIAAAADSDEIAGHCLPSMESHRTLPISKHVSFTFCPIDP